MLISSHFPLTDEVLVAFFLSFNNVPLSIFSATLKALPLLLPKVDIY